MQKLKGSVFFLVFLVISLLCAKESMVSVNRWSSTDNYPDSFEDYLQTTQTKAILDPKINGILYPVIGFPAMVTPDEPCFSVIFRHENNFYCEDVVAKIIRIDDNGRTEYLTMRSRMDNHFISAGEHHRKLRNDIQKVMFCPDIILPEAKYDLVVKVLGEEEEMISRNAVFFPHYEEDDPAKFLIVADPQIEDLLSKRTDDMNFNPENYPFHAENSPLNYDQQFGIIKATFSHLNSADTNFSIMLGDIAYGINYQQEYMDFYNLMTNLEIPMFSIPGNHDGYAQFTTVDDLTSPLESDGLEYWAKFLGPMNNAFNFRNKT